MNEELIIQTLENACQEVDLTFQIVREESILHIYIDREPKSNLNYNILQKNIYSTILKLNIPNLKSIYLYSRETGQLDPDWYLELSTIEDSFELERSKIEANKISLDKSIESAEIKQNSEIELDLSKFCLIRNRLLLTSDIVSPSQKICELVTFFDNLSASEKKQILPLLEGYFRSQAKLNYSEFSEEIQNWLTQITELNENEHRKASIWLSRYCFDTTKTMSRVEKVLDFEAEKAAAKQEEKNSKSQTNNTISNSPSVINSTLKNKNNQTNREDIANKSADLSINPILPIVWGVGTLILIFFGITGRNFYKNQVRNANKNIAPICQSDRSSEKQEQYCQLALNIAGENTFKQAVETSISLDRNLEESQVKMSYECMLSYPNFNFLSSDLITILSGVYLIDLKPEELFIKDYRVACIFKNTDRGIELVASDVIPNDWPSVTYREDYFTTAQNKLPTIYLILIFLIKLSSGILFTVIGMFLGRLLRRSLRFRSMKALFLSAFVFNILEIIFAILLNPLTIVLGFFPFGSYFFFVIVDSLAIFSTGKLIAGFEIDWSEGSGQVYKSIYTVIITRRVLGAILFLITGF